LRREERGQPCSHGAAPFVSGLPQNRRGNVIPRGVALATVLGMLLLISTPRAIAMPTARAGVRQRNFANRVWQMPPKPEYRSHAARRVAELGPGLSADGLAVRAHRRRSAEEPFRRDASVRRGHAGFGRFAAVNEIVLVPLEHIKKEPGDCRPPGSCRPIIVRSPSGDLVPGLLLDVTMYDMMLRRIPKRRGSCRCRPAELRA
jgi:hypothetical protein